MNAVMSYTLPWTAIQPSSGVLCRATSARLNVAEWLGMRRGGGGGGLQIVSG